MVVFVWFTASWLASRIIFLKSHFNERHFFLFASPLIFATVPSSLELSFVETTLATLAMNTMFLMIWLASSSVRYGDCNWEIRSIAKFSSCKTKRHVSKLLLVLILKSWKKFSWEKNILLISLICEKYFKRQNILVKEINKK